MRIAQILNGKAHWIFEANEMPNFPPNPQGNPIILVDITDSPEVQEGWDYDVETNTFSAPQAEVLPTQESLPTLEEIQIQTLLNTEYLVIMSEISNLA